MLLILGLGVGGVEHLTLLILLGTLLAYMGFADSSLTEMRFSPCGRYLHYLLVQFAPGGESESVCRVFLSTYAFDNGNGSSVNRVTQQPCSTTQWLTYTIDEPLGNIHVPYTLSRWDDDHLILCLPFLSCNPKIVRFDLQDIRDEAESIRTSGQDPMVTTSATGHVKTLAKQVHFPSSTPNRRPRLLYRSARSANRSDVLVLALDARRPLDDGSSGDSSRGDSSSTNLPVMLEWKLGGRDAEGGAWRPWDEHVDGNEMELAGQWRTYERLRGTFMRSDQRLQVVIRSGVNWTRKAFLSCS